MLSFSNFNINDDDLNSTRNEKENGEGDGINKVPREFLSLMKEVTCPICLSVVESPILTPCNHLFCKECILRALRPRTNDDSQHIDTRPKHQTCPVCKSKCSARGLLESPSIVTRLVERVSALREAFIQEHEGVSPSQYHSCLSIPAIKRKRTQLDAITEEGTELMQIELPSSTGDDIFKPIDEITGQKNKVCGQVITDNVNQVVSNDIETQLVGFENVEEARAHLSETKNKMAPFSGLTSSPVVVDKPDAIIVPNPSDNNNNPMIERTELSKPTIGKRGRKRKLTNEGDGTTNTETTPKSSVLKSKRRRISVDSQVKSPLTEMKDRTKSQTFEEKKQVNVTEIVTSMLSKENQAMVLEFCEYFQVPLCSIFSQETCSHLVVGTTDSTIDHRMIAKRSFKYLMAKLSSLCKIVSIHWIEACLSHKMLLPETKFIIDSDEETINLLKSEKVKGRISDCTLGHSGSGLFEGKSFYFYGQYFSKPTLAELIALSTMGGATIITEISEIRTGAMVLCDAMESNFEKDAGIIERHKPILSTAWILDCISLGQIIRRVDPYVIM